MRITRTLQRAALGAGALALAAGLAACGSGSDGSMDDGAAKDGSSAMATSDGGGDMGMSSEGSMASDGGDGMGSDMGGAAAGDMAMSSARGTFEGAGGKSVQGEVSIEDGTLTLSGFSSDEGPDLHLYLAKGDDEKAVGSGMELGAVSYDEAEQTFDVGGIDLSQYDHVVVHCDKARAVFGSAALS